jgi:hypothetical protein
MLIDAIRSHCDRSLTTRNIIGAAIGLLPIESETIKP